MTPEFDAIWTNTDIYKVITNRTLFHYEDHLLRYRHLFYQEKRVVYFHSEICHSNKIVIFLLIQHLGYESRCRHTSPKSIDWILTLFIVFFNLQTPTKRKRVVLLASGTWAASSWNCRCHGYPVVAVRRPAICSSGRKPPYGWQSLFCWCCDECGWRSPWTRTSSVTGKQA